MERTCGSPCGLQAREATGDIGVVSSFGAPAARGISTSVRATLPVASARAACLLPASRFGAEADAFEPQHTGGANRIDADLLRPCRLIATVMDLAMMTATERQCEFVAHLSPKRPMLCKAHMMRIGGCATANQTWLFGDKPYVLAIANSARFGMAKLALVDLRGVGPSSPLTRFAFTAFADLLALSNSASFC